MQIVSERTHRVLAFIEAQNRQGVSPDVDAVNAFANSPDHERVDVGIGATLQSLASVYDLMGPRYENEKFTKYLFRIGLTTHEYFIELSESGRALLQTLNTPILQDSATDVVEIVLDPQNPYAYAQALSAMSNVPDAMLVEPYFRIEQLNDISKFDNITRVLTGPTGPNLRKQDVEVLAIGLAGTRRSLGIRQAKQLHDRYLISSDATERVLMLGVSLGGIGKKVSTLTTLGPEVSTAIRELHEKVWEDASVIEPARQPES